jgi:hypothetical protein
MAMQKWEYTSATYSAVTEGSLKGLLNDFGERGWEVCGCVHHKRRLFRLEAVVFYFKRTLPTDGEA